MRPRARSLPEFWPRRGERRLPLLTALLLVVSFPPLHLLVPPFVALVPFAVFVRSLPGDREGLRSALRGGFFLGLVYWGILAYWIVVALVWLTPLALLAYAGAVLVLAGSVVLATWGLHRMVHQLGAPLWLALAAAWTGAEWIRGHVPDLAFPWLGLGTSLTGYPELVGVAELVGSRGVTFWIAAVNGVLAGAVLAWRRGRTPIREAALAALLVALPMAWGIRRARTLPVRPAAEVAVVQPDIPEDVKLDSLAALDSTLASLERLMPRIEPGSVDLVVWPEVTLPVFLEGRPALRTRVRRHARRVGAPILLGALGREGNGRGGYVPYNSAFLVTPERGLSDFRYDKHHLVPVVERVPWIDPAWLDDIDYFGAYGRGRGWPLGRTRVPDPAVGPSRDGDARFGTLICYESAFPGASRRFRREGADFFVNVTNDGWYGREPWWARTTALWQHPAHMVMRAIEHRVGVARAANTGISLFVDPLGRTYGETPLFVAGVRIGTVYTTDVRTLYTRLGDAAGGGSAVLLGMALGLAAWRGRRALAAAG